jgi:predicted lactoylglutathione lyase
MIPATTRSRPAGQPKNLTSASEAILVITADTRAEVDALADKALAAGAGPSKDPEGHPSMYIRNFADPDGHLFQVFWMDPAALQPTDA